MCSSAIYLARASSLFMRAFMSRDTMSDEVTRVSSLSSCDTLLSAMERMVPLSLVSFIFYSVGILITPPRTFLNTSAIAVI